jgi:2'-5' RNA ligase
MAPCFFAIYPDKQAREEIIRQQQDLCKRIGLPESQQRPARVFHLTVAPWGAARRLREPLEAALQRAASYFHFPAFDVVLATATRFSGRGGEHALVLEGDAETTLQMLALRIALAVAQKQVGLVATRQAFRPHLTLAYGRDLPDEAFSISPIRFRAQSVDMVISEYGSAKHHPIDRWRLDEICTA